MASARSGSACLQAAGSGERALGELLLEFSRAQYRARESGGAAGGSAGSSGNNKVREGRGVPPARGAAGEAFTGLLRGTSLPGRAMHWPLKTGTGEAPGVAKAAYRPNLGSLLSGTFKTALQRKGVLLFRSWELGAIKQP